MPKLHQDKHGIYAKVGGYIWRPVFPVSYAHFYADGTDFQVGETVRGQHRGGPLLDLRHENGRQETWFNHGAYMGPNQSPNSEDHYKPDYDWPSSIHWSISPESERAVTQGRIVVFLKRDTRTGKIQYQHPGGQWTTYKSDYEADCHWNDAIVRPE